MPTASKNANHTKAQARATIQNGGVPLGDRSIENPASSLAAVIALPIVERLEEAQHEFPRRLDAPIVRSRSGVSAYHPSSTAIPRGLTSPSPAHLFLRITPRRTSMDAAYPAT